MRVEEMKPVVQTFYDALDEGKMLGRKCTRCGFVEFPPVLVCNECSSTDMEWVEISGEAEMTDFSVASPMTSKPQDADLLPYALATVKLKEGAYIHAVVRGVTRKNRAELKAALPVPVKASIVQREGFKTVVFDLA